MRRRLVVEQVRRDPLHLDTTRVGEPPRLFETHGGKVHTGHTPALLGQPDGIAALAARELDRATGDEISGLADQEAIRLRTPDQLALGVAAIPGLAIHPR